MAVHKIYASVVHGVTKNVFVCEDSSIAHQLTQMSYGVASDIFAVDCTQIPVHIDDTYHDNCFWRLNEETGNEVCVEAVPTDSMKIQSLESQNAYLEQSNDLLIDTALDMEYQLAGIQFAV